MKRYNVQTFERCNVLTFKRYNVSTKKKKPSALRMAFSFYRERWDQSICSGADLYLFWNHIQLKKAMKPMAMSTLLKKVPIGGTKVKTPVKKLPMKFQKAVQKATIVFVFTRQI